MFQLPAGVQYRDPETLQASEQVSAFAKTFQPVLDQEAELNMLGENTYRRKRKLTPTFFSVDLPIYVRKMKADLFYYSESKKINPPEENKHRMLQDWLAKIKEEKKDSQEYRPHPLAIPESTNIAVATKDLITKPANLWQHSTSNKSRRTLEKLLQNDQLPEYEKVSFPVYQQFKYVGNK